MTNEEFIKTIKENYIEILKDIINDKQKEIRKQQITIAILISFIFIVTMFHFYNYKNFIKTYYMPVKKEVIVNE